MHRRRSAIAVASLAVAVGALWGCVSARLKGPFPYERRVALLERQGSFGQASVLRAALSDPDWRVAATACAIAIREEERSVASAAATLLLKKAFSDDRVEYFIQTVVLLGTEQSRQALVALIDHPSPSVRVAVLRTLARFPRPGREATLEARLRDVDPEIRGEALAALESLGTREADLIVARETQQWARLAKLGGTAVLMEEIRATRRDVRTRFVHETAKAGSDARDFLFQVLEDPELEDAHSEAYLALKRQGGPGGYLESFETRVAAEWQKRIDRELPGCSTEDWYISFSQLRIWGERPAFPFLAPAFGQAMEQCRAVALRVVNADQPRAPCTGGPGCQPP